MVAARVVVWFKCIYQLTLVLVGDSLNVVVHSGVTLLLYQLVLLCFLV